METQIKSDDVQAALFAINPGSLLYQEWCNVGMALHSFNPSDSQLDIWDQWSRQDARYRLGDCKKRWTGFHENGATLTVKTLFKMARQRGWSSAPILPKGEPMDFDTVLTIDEPNEMYVDNQKETVLLPRSNLNQVDQLKTYLSILFEPDEYVGYVVKSMQRDDGKFTPASQGNYDRTASELIKSLKKYPHDLGATIGDWNEQAGAWIRFNPCDGKGVAGSNATAYRYTLIESDDMSIEEQYFAYKRLNLPIACLVKSGKKSLHAIVRVDAKTKEEYTQRVEFIYNFLANHDFHADPQNKNVLRLSRMPGVTRGDQIQELIATNIGAKNFDEWRNMDAESIDNPLPQITTLKELFKEPIILPPSIIEGVLRQGHKMLISGPSKAGKSFLLMELAVCFAEGSKWFDVFQCQQCKVLYINLEIDGPSANQRMLNIYESMKIPEKDRHAENIYMWHLRGHAQPLNKLSAQIIDRVNMLGDVGAIIVDPIYKIMTGDENNASEMGTFCNYFDRIGTKTGCSIIFCHHHSKGAQGAKKAQDRASGSGVFTRDPDAVLDVSPLEIPESIEKEPMSFDDSVNEDYRTAWQVSGSLREFRPFKPFNIWFDAPLHKLDTEGELDDAWLEGDNRKHLKQYTNDEPEVQIKRIAQIRKVYDKFVQGSHGLKLDEMAKHLKRSPRTVRRWFEDTETGFVLIDGHVFTREDFKANALADAELD